ncbi:AroM family protein [Enorma phocaeensis]|uniref:AroM family protein n=1 Tax=Enorma phocaeensis TaxID=1871019 RepID=UPI003209C891
MRSIAGITVGQSPRIDMTDDIRSKLAPGLELIEYGALDDMTLEEVERELKPLPGDEVLVSRMRDGRQATFSGTRIVPLVQKRIDEAEAAGADAIILLCTGGFPELRHKVPLIIPQPLFYSVAHALAGGRTIAVMVPDKAQVEQARAWWGDAGLSIQVVQASPYGGLDAIARAARSLRGSNCAFLCLDCMGFSVSMRDIARRESGLDVLLPRTLVASTVSELLG